MTVPLLPTVVLWLIGLAIADCAFVSLACALSQGKNPEMFLQYSSAALAIGSPLLFGRGFIHRFGNQHVWAIALVYGVLQVLAYGSFLLPSPRTVTITLPSKVPDDRRCSRYVEEQRLPDGDFKYSIERNVDSGAPALRKIEPFWTEAKNAAQITTSTVFYLQFFFEELVFAMLALCKLLLGAQVIIVLRKRLTNTDSVIIYHTEPKHGNLVNGRGPHTVIIISLAVMTSAVVYAYGFRSLVAIGPVAGFVAILYRLTRGGRPLAKSVLDALSALLRFAKDERG